MLTYPASLSGQVLSCTWTTVTSLYYIISLSQVLDPFQRSGVGTASIAGQMASMIFLRIVFSHKIMYASCRRLSSHKNILWLTTWSYDPDSRIFLQAIVVKSVPSFRREREAYKAMATHNRTGSIWSNVTLGANRRQGPGTNFGIIDTLPAGTPLIVLCYSLGETESFTTAQGNTNTSAAWDFVVTSDQDSGGYVADVLVDTGGDIVQQLGGQGTCAALRQRLENREDSDPV
jgi:hypothetical protein